MADKSPAPVAPSMPLEEFVLSLSKRDRRPEIVNAFYATERSAKRLKGTAADFEARYAAFLNAPA